MRPDIEPDTSRDHAAFHARATVDCLRAHRSIGAAGEAERHRLNRYLWHHACKLMMLDRRHGMTYVTAETHRRDKKGESGAKAPSRNNGSGFQ